SHSSVYAINPVPRNLKDEQIKAVAKNGGVIAINFFSGFLDSTYAAKHKAFLAKYADEFAELTKRYGRGVAVDTLISNHKSEADAIRPSIEKVIDHIDYVVKLVGVDYVGIGADFDGAESFPLGMDSVADYPK